jgi:hypothetical protein
MDALVHVHILQEVPDLLVSVMIIAVIRQINPLFFDGADETFGVAVLPSGAHVCDDEGATARSSADALLDSFAGFEMELEHYTLVIDGLEAQVVKRGPRPGIEPGCLPGV